MKKKILDYMQQKLDPLLQNWEFETWNFLSSSMMIKMLQVWSILYFVLEMFNQKILFRY